MTDNKSDSFFCICDKKTKLERVFSVGEYSFCQCSDCKSLYRLPDTMQIDFYSDDYYGEGETEKFWASSIVALLNCERRRRARFIARKIGHSANVIDVGCGNGKFLKKIHEFCPDTQITGIELDAKSAFRAAKIKEIKVLSIPFEKCDFGLAKFDVLTSIHSFEHIPNPQLTLNKISSICEKQALVYIAIPNIKSIQYKIFGKKWLHLDPEWHLHFISPETLIKSMQKLGFKYLGRRCFHPTQNLSGFVLSSMNLITKRRDLLFGLFKNISELKRLKNIIIFMLLCLLSVILLPIAIIEDLISNILGRTATIDMVFKKQKD